MKVIAVFFCISGLLHLEELTLGNSGDYFYDVCITDIGIAHLSQMTKMKQISLSAFSEATGTGFSTWHLLEDLEILKISLRSGPSFPQPLCEVTFEYISAIPNIRELTFDSPSVTDENVAHLCKLSKLKTLDIYCTCVGHGFAGMWNLTELESLTVRGNVQDIAQLQMCKIFACFTTELPELASKVTYQLMIHTSKFLFICINLHGTFY